MKRAGEGRLDKPVALMMGVAAGALVFMMPIYLLEQAAVASGLANLLPPASPPLGFKAQIAAATLAALIGFGLAYALMRLLDRASGMFEPEQRAPVERSEEEAPRLRRRDRHPDAPARRPLSAARDLGEPVELEPAPPRRRTPLTLSLSQDEQPMPRMPWERDRAEPAAEAQPQQRVRAPLLAEPEPEPEPVAPAEPEPVEAAEDSFTAPHVPVEEPIEFAPEEEPVGEPDTSDAEPAPVILADPIQEEAEPLTAEPQSVSPEPVLPAVQPTRSPNGQETIGEMLARLERALDRRTPPRPHRVAEPAQVHSEEALEPIDNRLRSALENLKRFAPQRG